MTGRGPIPDRVGTPQTDGQEVTNQVDSRVLAILEAAQLPKSRASLLSTIGLTAQTFNFKKNLLPLIEAGWLAFGGHPFQAVLRLFPEMAVLVERLL